MLILWAGKPNLLKLAFSDFSNSFAILTIDVQRFSKKSQSHFILLRCLNAHLWTDHTNDYSHQSKILKGLQPAETSKFLFSGRDQRSDLSTLTHF